LQSVGASWNARVFAHHSAISSHSERSRGCNAADEVREARLSIPVLNLQLVPRGASTSLRFARDDASSHLLWHLNAEKIEAALQNARGKITQR
jgi:hypothetical protein